MRIRQLFEGKVEGANMCVFFLAGGRRGKGGGGGAFYSQDAWSSLEVGSPPAL